MVTGQLMVLLIAPRRAAGVTGQVTEIVALTVTLAPVGGTTTGGTTSGHVGVGSLAMIGQLTKPVTAAVSIYQLPVVFL
jgi:hypothetical protein